MSLHAEDFFAAGKFNTGFGGQQGVEDQELGLNLMHSGCRVFCRTNIVIHTYSLILGCLLFCFQLQKTGKTRTFALHASERELL
jgi:hypothetical protein